MCPSWQEIMNVIKNSRKCKSWVGKSQCKHETKWNVVWFWEMESKSMFDLDTRKFYFKQFN